MNIIQTSALRFQEGNSDKVYEVELVELSKTDKNGYLVNFRYGRYGDTLREGSKTSIAVPLAKAQSIYNSLVVSKINKGYKLQSGFDPLQGMGASTSVPSVGATPSLPDKAEKLQRRQQIALQNLKKIAGAKKGADYKRASRLIWRLGELKATAAVPDILEAVAPFKGKKKHHFRNYSIAWALGRIGDERGKDVLEKILDSKCAPIALNALYHVAPQPKELFFEKDYPGYISHDWKSIVGEDGEISCVAARLLKRINETKENFNDKAAVRLTAFYLFTKNNDRYRAVILEMARIAPFKFGSIWLIRHLFKIAEFELDADMLSVIIKRIEDSRPLGYDWQNDGYEDTYSFQTRNYLRRRTWRLFRRLGQIASPEYVRLAKGLLLAYKDVDGEEGKWTQYSYDDDWNSIATTFHFHRFASHEAYNQILFRYSKQFEPTPSKTRWHRVTEETDDSRVEAFRQLWDEQPEAFLDCLKASECQAVQDFGLRALGEKKDYCKTVGALDWADVLKVAYLETATFAKGYIESDHSDFLERLDYLRGLFVAQTSMAREFTQGWLQKLSPETLLADIGWHQDLIVSDYEDNRKASDGYHNLYDGHDDKQNILLGKLVDWVLALPKDIEQVLVLTDEQANDETFWDGDREKLERNNAAILANRAQQDAIIHHVSWTILNPLEKQVKSVDFGVLRDFISHPLSAVKKIGAEILVAQKHKPTDIPDDLFAALFESKDPEIRALAVRMLSNLDDNELAKMPTLLATLLQSEDEPVRNEARAIIQRVAAGNKEFSDKVLEELIPVCFRAEKSDGGHDILVACITEDLKQSWPLIDKNLLWRLLQAQSKAAQRVGASVLMERPVSDYSVRQWARLGKHSALDVRQWSQAAYDNNVERIKADFSNGLRLLDTSWDDSRAFAVEYFKTRFDAEQWTPDNLVLLCDSVRQDVQKLGRDLLRTFFKEQDGENYLLKLSQHPGRNVQLFASEFLQSYAGGKPAVIKGLNHYFIAVLSSINQGRVAKDRVLHFLLEEAKKSVEIAQIVSEILERQSVTVAIMDKGKFIKAMLELQQQYPDLKLPISQSQTVLRGFHPQASDLTGGVV